MLTFTSPAGSAIVIDVNKKKLAFFPKEVPAKGADLTFADSPEEKSTEGVISWPGEYDIDGISIRGLSHGEGGQVSYVVTAEDARCAILSSPLQDLSDHDLEILGNVDILVIPADDAKLVHKLVESIDPRILFPLSTGDDKIYAEVLKSQGAQGVAAVEEFKQKGSLPQEGREVVVLK